MSQNPPKDHEPMQGSALNGAITNALERHPQIEVPTDFAARIMGRLPAQKPVRAIRHFGRSIAYSVMIITAFAMLFAVGVYPVEFRAGLGFTFLIEMCLFAEVLAVALWLGLYREA